MTDNDCLREFARQFYTYTSEPKYEYIEEDDELMDEIEYYGRSIEYAAWKNREAIRGIGTNITLVDDDFKVDPEILEHIMEGLGINNEMSQL